MVAGSKPNCRWQQFKFQNGQESFIKQYLRQQWTTLTTSSWVTGSKSVGLHSLVKTMQEQDILTGSMLGTATFFLGFRKAFHKTCSTRAPCSMHQKDRGKYLGTATKHHSAQPHQRHMHLQMNLSCIQAYSQAGWGGGTFTAQSPSQEF